MNMPGHDNVNNEQNKHTIFRFTKRDKKFVTSAEKLSSTDPFTVCLNMQSAGVRSAES